MWVEINLSKQKRKAGRKKRERGEVDIIWDLKSKNVCRKEVGRENQSWVNYELICYLYILL